MSEEAVLSSIAKCGATTAVAIAQLLFPNRSCSACKALVCRKWQPHLKGTLSGGHGRAAVAVTSVADLDRALAVCGDPGK